MSFDPSAPGTVWAQVEFVPGRVQVAPIEEEPGAVRVIAVVDLPRDLFRTTLGTLLVPREIGPGAIHASVRKTAESLRLMHEHARLRLLLPRDLFSEETIAILEQGPTPLDVAGDKPDPEA